MPEKKLKLKSMNKIQLLTIMRQQELEINKLNAEKQELTNLVNRAEEKQLANIRQNMQSMQSENAGSLEDSCTLANGIIQSAKTAADLYLKNIRLIESEKITASAEQKIEEKERGEKATLTDLRIVAYLYMNFINQSHSILHEMIERYNLTEMLEIDKSAQIDEPQEP